MASLHCSAMQQTVIIAIEDVCMNSLLIKYRPWIVCLGTTFSMFVVMRLDVYAFTVF